MGIKEMQGTSAYLEYIGPKGRKRKKNCAYYVDEICHCKRSNYYLLRCGGRSFCMYFDDSDVAKIKYKNDIKNIKDSINKKTSKTNEIKKKQERASKTYKEKILSKKIKVKDIGNNKKYLLQLVAKDKENIEACKFYIDSEIGRILSKSREGSYVEFEMNKEKHKFIVLEIRQE